MIKVIEIDSKWEENALKCMGTANSDVKYISLGIKLDKNTFTPVENRKVFSDFNFPPSKPVRGGFWGSIYTPNGKYRSDWERFILERLYLRPEWTEKIKQTSTVFNLKSDAKVIVLNQLMDIFPVREVGADGGAMVKPLFELRTVRIGNRSLEEYANHRYVDYELLATQIDALILTKNFITHVDWILDEYKRRVLAGEDEFDDDLTPLDLNAAEMFEDWNTESILVFNPDAIENIEYVEYVERA